MSSAPGPTARRGRISPTCAPALWAACAARSGPSWGSSTRWRPRCRRARSCSPTCASRATGWPPCTACRARACFSVPHGLGGRSLSLLCGARRGPRRGPGRRSRSGGGRRLPVRLRRAGHGGAGAHAALNRRCSSTTTATGCSASTRPAAGWRRPAWTSASPDFAALAQAFDVHAEAVAGTGAGLRRRACRGTSPTTSRRSCTVRARLEAAADHVAPLVPRRRRPARSRGALAQDPGVPDRVAAGLRPDAQPVRAAADGDRGAAAGRCACGSRRPRRCSGR